MARVESLLSILAQQNADELQLGTDREPKLLSRGAVTKLSLPATSEQTVRELLGDILTPERDEVIAAKGRIHTKYVSAVHGTFDVKIAGRPGTGFDVALVREGPSLTALPDPPATSPVTRLAPVHDAAAPSRALSTPDSSELAGLLSRAWGLRASDLHLVTGAIPMVRVDGTLRALSSDPVDLSSLLPLDDGQNEAVRAGHSYETMLDTSGSGRARMHVFRTAEGLAAAIRLLPDRAPTLASLHLPVALEDLVELSHGLVLVCGATGAGKSTTLAALAQEALRRRSIVLATLEDPLEHALSAGERSIVRRRQVGRDVPDFVTGLRDALREDPDVLLVGEMRDPATTSLALTAAETGHLVLSSMHSGSASSAVERILDAYPHERAEQVRSQLADSIRAIVVQRLVPRARGSGRIPALEVLRVTHAVASMIREGKTAQLTTAMQSGRREGMMTLERCLAELVNAGEIDLDAARAAANDSASLALMLARP